MTALLLHTDNRQCSKLPGSKSLCNRNLIPETQTGYTLHATKATTTHAEDNIANNITRKFHSHLNELHHPITTKAKFLELEAIQNHKRSAKVLISKGLSNHIIHSKRSKGVQCNHDFKPLKQNAARTITQTTNRISTTKELTRPIWRHLSPIGCASKSTHQLAPNIRNFEQAKPQTHFIRYPLAFRHGTPGHDCHKFNYIAEQPQRAILQHFAQ